MLNILCVWGGAVKRKPEWDTKKSSMSFHHFWQVMNLHYARWLQAFCQVSQRNVTTAGFSSEWPSGFKVWFQHFLWWPTLFRRVKMAADIWLINVTSNRLQGSAEIRQSVIKCKLSLENVSDSAFHIFRINLNIAKLICNFLKAECCILEV